MSHEVTKWGMMGRAVQRECRETTGMDDVPRVEGKERKEKEIQKINYNL